MKFKDKKWFKLVSWITVNVFVLNLCVGNLAYAKRYMPDRKEISNSETMQIPFEHGEVTDSYLNGSAYNPVVIIQDLHANYEVQKNIIKLLEHIDKYSGISTIGLEGCWGEIDTSFLSTIPE
ncbi:MAG: hypothetical protein ACOC5T_01530, partial [Elusimicrobiota bacterium]